MTSIPEIREKAKTLLWLDEEEDSEAVNEIIKQHQKENYDGRLIRDYQLSTNGDLRITFGDHPLIAICQYFDRKYGEDDGMAYYLRWLWKIGLFTPPKELYNDRNNA
jgi:hypothetical protein